jgi:cation diffusion facilitator family transporter
MAGGGHGTKAVIAALLANAGIAVAKFVGFVITGSASMLAESIHSVADSGNQGLLLLGGKRARRQADEEHPFGYGRERFFWAFVVALVLFSLGGAFAIFEGVSKIRHPHEVESPEIAIGILAFAVLLEGFSFRTAIKEADLIRGEAGWWEFIRRSKNPELPVVLLEDLGALIGLVLALGAVVTTLVTDDPLYDGIGTLSIGVLLTVIAIVLAIEMKSLLIGESADKKVRESIRSAIEIEPSVEQLIHMRTQHIGPDELLVAAKVSFLGDLSVPEIAAAVNRVETSVRRAVPTARIMYIEPDVMATEIPEGAIAPDDVVGGLPREIAEVRPAHLAKPRPAADAPAWGEEDGNGAGERPGER